MSYVAQDDLRPVNVLLSALREYCDPFRDVTWYGLDKPITREEVQSAADDWDVLDEYGGDWREMSRKEHIGRVAYFVLAGWDDPIDIDVGVPELGQYQPASWFVTDGNHRLAAAIFLEHETIRAQISGSEDYAAELGLWRG